MTPKFSIVVPVYKTEAYLGRCIDSLIRQTLTDIEIILVDDGSPDNCPRICDQYEKKDSRIKVIHQKNAGVSAARNKGLEYATGEWILFCDSDDWMEANACEVLYQTGIEKNVDIVVGDIKIIHGKKQRYNQFFSSEFVFRSRKRLDQLVMADLYQGYCPLPPKTPSIGYGGPWNKAVRRCLLLQKNIRFDTSLLGIFDDILYTAYLYANAQSIAYVQKAVYNYVSIPTSITKTYKPNSLDINRRIFQAFRKFIVEYSTDNQWEPAFHAMVIRRFEETLRLYFFNKKNPQQLTQILRELKQTMNTEPYTTAIKKVDTAKLLPSQKKAAFFMRMRFPAGLWVLYRLKTILRKV